VFKSNWVYKITIPKKQWDIEVIKKANGKSLGFM